MKLILLSFTSLFLFGCNSVSYTPETYSGKTLMFGSGGGISNQQSHYLLFENGQLFKLDKDSDAKYELASLDKNQVEQFFNTAKSTNFGDLKVKVPMSASGNMQNYLNFSKNGKSEKIKWNGGEELNSSSIQVLFRNLMALSARQEKLM